MTRHTNTGFRSVPLENEPNNQIAVLEARNEGVPLSKDVLEQRGVGREPFQTGDRSYTNSPSTKLVLWTRERYERNLIQARI